MGIPSFRRPLTANLTLPTRAELVDEVLGPIPDALRLGGAFGLFLLQLAQNAARGSAPAPTIPNCTKISETNYVCVKTIPAPVLAGGSQLTFTRLAALDDGISLGGMMRIVPLTTGARPADGPAIPVETASHHVRAGRPGDRSRFSGRARIVCRLAR